MKKKLFSLCLLLTLALQPVLRAATPPTPPEEGMWLPLLISQNIEEMRRLGIKLNAEDIYNVNKSSLKDAIVSLGGFCTAEIISADGLVLTNHHCAYDAIQNHSSVKNDYLKDGFWAKTKADELPNAGLTASVLYRMEDVTPKIKAAIEGLKEPQRSQKIQELSQNIVKEATENTHYTAYVRDMFSGGEFYLFVFEVYKDVRLVGAPPESIGKFGGDTDNWMWPRHTGDFSLLRIYSGKDGKPAEYSKDNIPLKPRHFLPVNTKGVKPGDFTMIMGFPGRTQRYLTAEAVKLAQEESNPARIKLREKRLALMKEDMDASQEIRIKYASKYASISNYYKYFIGQNKGLRRLKTVDTKLAEEKKFMDWVNADPARQAKYGNVLADIKASIDRFRKFNKSLVYMSEAVLAPEVHSLAYQYSVLEKLLADPKSPANQQAIKASTEKLSAGVKEHFKDYNAATDRKIYAALLEYFYKDIPADQHAPILKDVAKKYKGDFNKFAADVFAKSIFVDSVKLRAFLAKPALKTLQNDPAYKTINGMMNYFTANIRPQAAQYQQEQTELTRLFIEGQREMSRDRKFYPDANSTLRLTYGTVQPYKPMDAVSYDFNTTAQGILEKEDPNDPEFVCPPRLVDLLKRKDYGRWANAQGELEVCFISTTDITGGNSGSPVLNDKGELIGLAFDGNWEAMTGDLVFDKELKRTINVDIRYVLFIVDKYAGASHLINELKLVN